MWVSGRSGHIRVHEYELYKVDAFTLAPYPWRPDTHQRRGGTGEEEEAGGVVSRHPHLQKGLVFKAHRLLYHSTLGLRVIKKRTRRMASHFFPSRTHSLPSTTPRHVPHKKINRTPFQFLLLGQMPADYRGTSVIRNRPPP